MVERGQQVEERSEVSQVGLHIRSHPMEEMLQMTDPRDHREQGLDQSPFLPGPFGAELEVLRHPLGTGESQIGEGDRLPLQLLHQGEEGLVMGIGSIPTPGDDLPTAVDQPAELDSHDPAMIGLPLPPDLLRATPLTPRVNQLDAIAVHYSEEGRISEEVVTPGLVGLQEPLETGAMGQLEPSGVVPFEPAVEGAELDTLEGEEEADGDQLAGVELGLGMLGDLPHPVVNEAEKCYNEVDSDHGFVPPLVQDPFRMGEPFDPLQLAPMVS